MRQRSSPTCHAYSQSYLASFPVNFSIRDVQKSKYVIGLIGESEFLTVAPVLGNSIILPVLDSKKLYAIYGHPKTSQMHSWYCLALW